MTKKLKQRKLATLGGKGGSFSWILFPLVNIKTKLTPPTPSPFLTARVRKQHRRDWIPHLRVPLAQASLSHLPSLGEGVSVGSQAWGSLYLDPQRPGSTPLLPVKGMRCLLGSGQPHPPDMSPDSPTSRAAEKLLHQ